MIHRKHFDDAAAMTDVLLAEQRRQGLSDDAIAILTGLNRSTTGKWRYQRRLPTLKGLLAMASALGLEVIVRRKRPRIPHLPQAPRRNLSAPMNDTCARI